MKKILVFVDYDLIIRHFIKTRTFDLLEAVYDVKYVFHKDNTSKKQGIYTDISKLGVKNYTTCSVPRFRMGSWDKLYCITALNRQRGTDNYTSRLNLIIKTRGYWRARLYEALSLPIIFPIVKEYFIKKMGEYAPLKNFLEQEKPDLIIHPSILAGYFINELLMLCPRLDIPLVLLMNSWDNPSVKSVNTGTPDRLVVWGPQTKNHAITYMGLPAENVLEFGAAQFDVYRKPVEESDSDLRRMFEVPKNIPIILYGGASKLADETRHLQMLDKAISDGHIPPCHIIYRPHPWRGELGFGEISFFDVDFDHVSMDPHMEEYYKQTAVGKVDAFYAQDYSVTRKILELVSAVISPLSTILLESTILGKPILMFYPNSTSNNADENVRLAIEMPYFRGFWDCLGVHVEFDASKLSMVVSKMLIESKDSSVRDALQAHARKFVRLDGITYSESILCLADELTHSK